jgi:hypothetical protein
MSCITDSEKSKTLNSPSWISGIWEGGSPIKLHLEFRDGSCYNASNQEQFVGYEETNNNGTTYSLRKDNNESIFTKISSNQIDWYVDNGKINNTTRMIKK